MCCCQYIQISERKKHSTYCMLMLLSTTRRQYLPTIDRTIAIVIVCHPFPYFISKKKKIIKSLH